MTASGTGSADGATPIGIKGLGQVSLFVRDTERAVAWYRDTIGLPHLFTAGDLAFFDLGGVRLYLHTCGADDWKAGSVLYLLVDDIAEAYRALETAGVTTTEAPHVIYTDASGAQEWMAFFEDPDGNTLALLSRVPAEA
jgi:catechol 2,3-dioxygenase-like lactoylglutathione lyase family enzyme